MAKTATSSKLLVALNPANPEANSWYDPATGVNLFLGTPLSEDLSGKSAKEMDAVYRGIRAGLLIVAEGSLPEGVGPVEGISRYAAPRARWSPEHAEAMKKALDNHQTAVSQV